MHSIFSPPIIYQAFIVLMVASSLLLPTTRIIPMSFNLVGIALFLLGAGVANSAKTAFKKTNTPMRPSGKPTMLHTDGAFRYTRNPMYLGITIGLLGLAIVMRSVINLVFPAAFLAIIDFAFVRHEEQIMEEELGDEYREYKRRTRRWI